jgi:hypothetical protein
MSNLYDYVFHYNHYTELWNAIPRGVYERYWNNDDVAGVLKSKNVNTLIEMITKNVKV